MKIMANFAVIALLASTLMADKIDEIIVKSGISFQYDQIPSTLAQGLTMAEAQIPDKDVLKVLKKVKQDIMHTDNSDAVKKDLRKRLEENLSEKDMETILKWLESPAGVKMTELEKSASEPENAIKMLAYNPELSGIREKQIQRMVSALDVREMNIEFMFNAQLAGAYAVIMAMNPEQQMDLADLRKKLESQKKMFEPIVDKMTVKTIAFTYKDASDDEIEEYLGFIESDLGIRYHKITIESTMMGLGDLMSQLATSIYHQLKAFKKGNVVEDM